MAVSEVSGLTLIIPGTRSGWGTFFMPETRFSRPRLVSHRPESRFSRLNPVSGITLSTIIRRYL